MKVLQINSVCGIRSTGRIVTELADELVKQGNECKIAYGREIVPNKYKDISIHIGNQRDLLFHVLQTRIFDRHCFASTKATRKFIDWIKIYNPDIIHLHNLHGYYIDIRVLFSYLKQSEIPVIWTMHDCWPFTGHCAHFTFIGCNKWKKGCYTCTQKEMYPASFFIDRSIQNYIDKKILFASLKKMAIVTPSQWLADKVKKSFLGNYPIFTIHNSIDTKIFKPTKSNFREKYNLSDKIIVLGVASAWGKRKGLEDFVKLASILDEQHQIVIVGLSKKQIKKMPHNIITIEKTDSVQELAEIYSASDYYVNLTYEDTYPTTNLEAQACGTPCITYKTGGSIESVPKKNIVNQGNISGIVDLLKQKLELKVENMDLQCMLAQYISLYKSYFNEV